MRDHGRTTIFAQARRVRVLREQRRRCSIHAFCTRAGNQARPNIVKRQFLPLEYNSVLIMPTLDSKSFRSAFLGEVFEPADVGYNKARQIWNASVDKQPRVIA